MISDPKKTSALWAMNAILVLARKIALESGNRELSSVMDKAEYLIMLMLEAGDTTRAFRDQLVGLAEEHAMFGYALERFDRDAES